MISRIYNFVKGIKLIWKKTSNKILNKYLNQSDAYTIILEIVI